MHYSYCSSWAYQHSDQYELLWVDYRKWKQSRIEVLCQPWTTSSNSEVVQGLYIFKCFSYYSSLLGYYFVWVDECVAAFGRIMVPSTSRDKQSKRCLSCELWGTIILLNVCNHTPWQHHVTSQVTLSVSNTAVRTSNLALLCSSGIVTTQQAKHLCGLYHPEEWGVKLHLFSGMS